MLTMSPISPIERTQQVPDIGGTYRHYKGKLYTVVAVGRHTESLEQCVVYEALYNSPEFGDRAIWIRPLEMFMGMQEVNGVEVQRFTQVEAR